MIKIEADTLQQAYENAASALNCSVTELSTEVVQHPREGYLGLFKKTAIIVAVREKKVEKPAEVEKVEKPQSVKDEAKVEKLEIKKEVVEKKENLISKKLRMPKVKSTISNILHHRMAPASFVSSQEDEDEDLKSGVSYTADYDDAFDEKKGEPSIEDIVKSVSKEINSFFALTCFEIEKIEVSVYDSETVFIEFKGADAALLIGKEGYRYKAISYMLFNWINSKYKVQLRLEIAEFLKNQEESVSRYIESVCETIDRDGRAQTKILDGVLVQIALKELRDKYPDKYVVIRSTRDGLKYIIVNDYHQN